MVLTKAFDTVALVAQLKAIGVPEAEKVAKDIVDQCVFPWLSASLVLEAASNPIYAIGVPVLAALQGPIDAELASLMPAPAAS